MGTIHFLALYGLLLITTTSAASLEAKHLRSWIERSDLPPKANSNGLCYTYTVQAAGTCQSIAPAYGITVAEIETYNAATYGWKGCSNIHQGDFICLSPGDPPMPVALPHATCGPQVPGTARPSDYSILSSLNPCPSGETCTAEGQCICGDTPSNCPTSSVSKTTTKAAETKPTTQAEPTTKTTAKETTSTQTTTEAKITTEPKPTTTSTKTTAEASTTTTSETAKWTIAGYTGDTCEGDYFVVEGDSRYDGKCIDLRSGLSAEQDDSGIFCRFYTDGGFNSTDCASSPLVWIWSWSMKGGTCTFYGGDCDVYEYDFEDVVSTDGSCAPQEYYHPHYTDKWKKLQCTVG